MSDTPIKVAYPSAEKSLLQPFSRPILLNCRVTRHSLKQGCSYGYGEHLGDVDALALRRRGCYPYARSSLSRPKPSRWMRTGASPSVAGHRNAVRFVLYFRNHV